VALLKKPKGENMSNQILKGFTMLALIVGLGFVTAVASANGQTPTVVSNIPFEFTVGDRALPAGKYMVQPISQSSAALMIRGDERSAVRLANPINTSKRAQTTKLVFHRYGERYFLSEVWVAGESTGRQLRKSAQERITQSQLASLGPKANTYEMVEVVAWLR
jgi:hypothetical protein